MNRTISILLLIALVVSLAATPVLAMPAQPSDTSASQVNPASGGKDGQPAKEDNRPDPLTTKQAELKEKALEAKLNGKAYGKTHEVARGQFVELEREGEDPIWTVLGEFDDFPHNNIAEPDRSYDNTTMWTPDFNRDYYMNMLFGEGPGANSMRNFYIEQSANRYTVHGDVTDWVALPGEACDYDDGDPGPGDATHVWQFLIDSINGWYNAQIAAGKTPEEINDYLSQFDVWDRYDYNGNDNFNEPDGYIDHMQFVHAGEGNEAGGGALGDCSIWSHSWYAYSNLIGTAGPDFNKFGGVQIGNSNYWVGKYTIQPENGGVGVFTHEYGHDLGLPDLYDTSGGENGTGFWTLMSSGSWMGDGTVDIGSKSSHMGAWEKFQLGWLNYEVASAGQKSEHKLGPMETNTKQAQGLFVILPKKEIITNIGTPYEGNQYYYSGAGDYLDNFMYKSFNLTGGSSLTAKVKYNIELDWDYAYLVYSQDGGATWTPIETNLSTTTDPNGQNFGYGITGVSGGWVDLTANLPEGNVLLGFRYWTDANTGGFGFMVDNIQVTGDDLDGAETDAGWTFDGFRMTNGIEAAFYNHYYVAEFRQYYGYDTTLRDGPYNWGFQDQQVFGAYHVEHFPYQDGLLISYWDTSQRNNQVRRHPGQGLLLPIDAHPTSMTLPGGGAWRNRIQTFDSTFTLEPTDALSLHWLSVPYDFPSQPAVPVFDDSNSYYDPANPMGSVINPNTGTQIRIQSISAQGNFMQVEVRPAK